MVNISGPQLTVDKCLEAAVSWTLRGDDENKVQEYEEVLRLGWKEIHQAWKNDWSIISISGKSETETSFFPECSDHLARTFCAEAILWGARFQISHPCGKRQVVGPFVKASFH